MRLGGVGLGWGWLVGWLEGWLGSQRGVGVVERKSCTIPQPNPNHNTSTNLETTKNEYASQARPSLFCRHTRLQAHPAAAQPRHPSRIRSRRPGGSSFRAASHRQQRRAGGGGRGRGAAAEADCGACGGGVLRVGGAGGGGVAV